MEHSENNFPIQNNQQPKKRARFTVIFVIGVLVFLLIAAGYFFKKYRDLSTNPKITAEQQSKDLVARVGKLIALPDNEQPTVATVTDLQPLKNQTFFANAQLNDKVLIYTLAKKAILYRPAINKIVEVAPVNIGADANANTATNETKK